ncbi:MAG TPA: ATP-binding protein [Bacteroidota bacterium]
MEKLKSNKLELQVESRTEKLTRVREFVSRAARKFGFGEDDVSKIALAVDEACTNIIKHAYNFDPDRLIHLSILINEARFEVVITDDGRKFDPELFQIRNMTEYVKQYKRSGFGMYLMKSLVDKVEYTIKPGARNEVRLTKYLHQ